MKAVLLAAGRGRRMLPLTVRRPKVLVPVAGRPLLAWVVERAVAAGVDELRVVVHEQEAAVRAFFRAHPVKDVRVSFVRQSEPLGTGHAIALARKGLRDDFLVLSGDTLPGRRDFEALAGGSGAMMGSFRVDDASAFGALRVSAGRLVSVAEKSRTPPSNYVNVGAYRVDAELARLAAAVPRSKRGEYEFTDALNAYAKSGGRLRVVRFKEWMEAGRPWDLLAIQERLMSELERKVDGQVEKGVTIHGPVQIGKGTKIKAGVYIEGPVIIGRDCKIGPNSYLRPSTSIGDGCHIGASVEIKNSIIMDRTNVPHLSYIGDSVLGSDVNLGAGTSVANLKITPHNVRVTLEDGTKIDTGRRKLGTIVGDGTKIGINCSLNPGTIVGADCMIGLGRVLSGWIPTGSRLV